MDISTLNLIVGTIFIIAMVFSFVVFMTSYQSVSDYDKERVERESSSIPETFRSIYKAFGNWLYWIASKAKFIYNIQPQNISLLGLGFNLIGAFSISFGIISIGAISITAGGILDILDGKVARERKIVRKSGSLLDSVLDRIGEIAVFSAICFFLMKKGYYTSSVIAALAMGFSMLVSYIRAKAEALGLSTKEGIMRRQERIFIIAVSLFLDSILHYITQKIIFLPVGITIIFFGGFITSITRFKKSYEELKGEEKGKNNEN